MGLLRPGLFRCNFTVPPCNKRFNLPEFVNSSAKTSKRRISTMAGPLVVPPPPPGGPQPMQKTSEVVGTFRPVKVRTEFYQPIDTS